MPRRALPPLIAGSIALAILGATLVAALARTEGTLAYPVDDAYIHLAIAKHLAFDGVYGVTRYDFTAASSSVVWPWLLAAAMRVAGDRVWLPLGLNVLAAAALLLVVDRGLRRDAPSYGPRARGVVLLALVLLVPLPSLVLVGMEHVLHAALTVAFVLEAGRVIAGDERDGWTLPALAAGLLAVRYEGAFPVGLATLLLAARGRLGRALAVALAGATPVATFGAYALAHGSLFLPTSVALKRRHLSLATLSDAGHLLGGDVLAAMRVHPFVMSLVVAPLVLLVREVRKRGLYSADAARLAIALGTTVAHVELASLGWFARYEAYLVALDVVVVTLALAPDVAALSRQKAGASKRPLLVASAVAIALLASLATRAIGASLTAPTACRNIYEQQVQTARFLARSFPREVAVVNDIGAVAYYGDAPLVDLVGLASLDVARAKGLRIDGGLTVEQIDALTRGARVAVVYDAWFPAAPASWVRVGRLRIEDNRVCGSDEVSVYATSPDSAPRVAESLRAFVPSLPAHVRSELASPP